MILKTIPTIESVAITTVTEIVFWILILLGAVYLLPKIVHGVSKTHPSTLEARGTRQGVALGSAFGLAAIAASVGLSSPTSGFARMCIEAPQEGTLSFDVSGYAGE